MKTPLRCVLTGDLILSEKMSRAIRRTIPTALARFTADLRALGIEMSEIDVFRGDAWQALVAEPARGLSVAMYIRAAARASSASFDTRIAVAVGAIDDAGDGRISTGYGEAFTLSGRTLDAMARDRHMQLRVAGIPAATDALLDASIHLLDRIVGQWTPAQARVAAGALRGLSQEEIGAEWPTRPISQQAVAQHMARASWGAVEHMLKAWQLHADEFIEQA